MRTRSATAPADRLGGTTLAVTATVLVALNLRPAVVSVSPVLPTIRTDLVMGAPLAGLLTTLPVLCFGGLAPLAPRLARRIGMEPAIALSLVVVGVGIVLRVFRPEPLLFLGSFLAGAGIAGANVLVPAMIKRDFAGRLGVMTGIYSASLNMGAAAAAGLTIPLGGALGFSWHGALGMWVVPVGVALVLWLPILRGRPSLEPPGEDVNVLRALLRDPVAWAVTGYLAMQSFEFYAAAAWLPTIFEDNGLPAGESGWLLAWANITGMAGAIGLPIIANRSRDQRAMIATVIAFYLLGLAGLLIAPAPGAWIWMTLFGVAQGGGFALGLLLISLRSPDTRHAAELSGMAQCVGYLVAATGPVILGSAHALTGRWELPVGVLLAVLLPMTALGMSAGRDRLVRQ